MVGGQGFIDQSLGDFFASTAVGYPHHMEQSHPYDAIRRRPQRADRFRPLAANHAANYPDGTHAAPGARTRSSALGGRRGPVLVAPGGRRGALPPVRGVKTAAEQRLLDGDAEVGQPMAGIFADDSRPAEEVLAAKRHDEYDRRAGGEPLTDATQSGWDGFNGVAGP